jgi:hypothetical protein
VWPSYQALFIVPSPSHHTLKAPVNAVPPLDAMMMCPQPLCPWTMCPWTMCPRPMCPLPMCPRPMCPRTMCPRTMCPRTMCPRTMCPPPPTDVSPVEISGICHGTSATRRYAQGCANTFGPLHCAPFLSSLHVIFKVVSVVTINRIESHRSGTYLPRNASFKWCKIPGTSFGDTSVLKF